MGKLRGVLVPMSVAGLVTLAVPSIASASGGPALTPLTTPSQWYTVANSIGESYGLAPDGSGGLLSFSYTSSSSGPAPSPLIDFGSSTLTQAALGSPANALPTPLTSVSAASGQWDAGIAVATNGTIYFTTSSFGTIWAYSPSTGLTTALPVISPPWSDLTGLVLSPNGQDLYVSDQETGDIYRVSLATGDVTTVLTTSGGDLQQLAFDASGNLFVADQGDDQVVEVPAATLASQVAPATVGSGAQVVIDWGTSSDSSLTGLAFDAAGNLYSGTYGVDTGYPSIVMVTAAQLAEVEATGIPATFANGQLLDVADATTPAVDGPQPLTVVGDTLYVGNYDGQNIVAVPLSGLGVSRPERVTAVRSGTTLTATWTGGSGPFRCELLQGFHDPTGFALNTVTTSCSFGGLSLFVPYGVEVISQYGTTDPVAAEAFAPAPGLTCQRGSRTRHYTTPGSRCPRGWHAAS